MYDTTLDVFVQILADRLFGTPSPRITSFRLL